MQGKRAFYSNSSQRRRVEIGGRTVWVDSYLEERVLRELEASGFAGRWRRLERGLTYHGVHYTPDVELAVEQPDGTHRALVEIKPTRAHFAGNRDVLRRMFGVQGYYRTDYFLLYAGDERTWYRIVMDGDLIPFQIIPGKLRIDQLHTPFHLPTWRVYGHHYSERPEVLRHVLVWFVGFLEAFVLAIVGPPKRRRRRRGGRHK